MSLIKNFYKTYVNKLSRIKNLSKKLYFGTAVTEKKNKPRELWKLIKIVISKKRPTTTSSLSKLLIEDNMIDNPNEIYEHVNDYFVNIGKLISKSCNKPKFITFSPFLRKSVSQTIMFEQPPTTRNL